MPRTVESDKAKNILKGLLEKNFGVLKQPKPRRPDWLVSQDNKHLFFLTYSSKDPGFYDISPNYINECEQYPEAFLVLIWREYNINFIIPFDKLKENLLESNLRLPKEGNYKLHLSMKNGFRINELPNLNIESYQNKIPNRKYTLELAIEKIDKEEYFNFYDGDDAEQKAFLSIARRQGQQQFRQTLLKIYDYKCVITNCNAEAALEAAHIMPYVESGNHHPANGLILRADLHTLFDLNLFVIHPETLQVILNPILLRTDYCEINKRKIRLPVKKEFYPETEFLIERMKKCEWIVS